MPPKQHISIPSNADLAIAKAEAVYPGIRYRKQHVAAGEPAQDIEMDEFEGILLVMNSGFPWLWEGWRVWGEPEMNRGKK
jgi:hypothetical protein